MKCNLFEPLFEVTKQQSVSFTKELKREMPKNHILSKEKYMCIGKREGRDDYLFYVESIKKYAMVHLTWNKESNPTWPHTKLYESVEQLKEKWQEDFGEE